VQIWDWDKYKYDDYIYIHIYIHTYIHTCSFAFTFLVYKMSFLCRYGIGTNTNTITKYMNIYMYTLTHGNSLLMTRVEGAS